MAGHSKFANIKHRKGRQDEKRSALFTKHNRAITAAARQGGPDPDANPTLRSVVKDAKRDGMPKDKIENAIKASQGNAGGDGFEQVIYEGYGPSGIAVIAVCLTDNRNRTAALMREIFSRAGGSLGEGGSVQYMFRNVGIIVYKNTVDFDELFEFAVENNALDVEEDEDSHVIISEIQELHKLGEELEKKFGQCEEMKIIWQANDLIDIDREASESVERLLIGLEDCDDVQNSFHNANLDLPEEE